MPEPLPGGEKGKSKVADGRRNGKKVETAAPFREHADPLSLLSYRHRLRRAEAALLNFRLFAPIPVYELTSKNEPETLSPCVRCTLQPPLGSPMLAGHLPHHGLKPVS